MNQVERALRDGIRVEGGERLGWIAWDDILGCYHNKHNNAREAIKWARICRENALDHESVTWRRKFREALENKQKEYDRVHNRHAASDAAAG